MIIRIALAIAAAALSACAHTNTPLSGESMLLRGNILSAPNVQARIEQRALALNVSPTLFTLPPEALAVAAPNPAVRAAVTTDQNKLIDEAYAQVVGECRAVMGNFENRARDMRWIALSVALLGATAGSIVVPALTAKAVVAKSTVAAWGGFSGGANMAQMVLKDEGLDAGSIVAEREKMRADVMTGLEAYYKAASAPNPSPEEKRVALQRIMAACTFYWISSATSPAVPAAAPAK